MGARVKLEEDASNDQSFYTASMHVSSAESDSIFGSPAQEERFLSEIGTGAESVNQPDEAVPTIEATLEAVLAQSRGGEELAEALSAASVAALGASSVAAQGCKC